MKLIVVVAPPSETTANRLRELLDSNILIIEVSKLIRMSLDKEKGSQRKRRLSRDPLFSDDELLGLVSAELEKFPNKSVVITMGFPRTSKQSLEMRNAIRPKQLIGLKVGSQNKGELDLILDDVFDEIHYVKDQTFIPEKVKGLL